MPIEHAINTEAQPPEGGLFLCQEELVKISTLVGSFDETIAQSRKAQATLREIFPADKPELEVEARGLLLDYVAQRGAERRLREEKVINLLEPDPNVRKRIKHALYSDTCEVSPEDRQKWREWLGDEEQQMQNLHEAGIAVDYEPPHVLLEFGVAYRARLAETAQKEADTTTVLKRTAETQITRLLATMTNEEPNLFGSGTYKQTFHRFGNIPYLVRCETDDKSVHFIDLAVEDFENNRLAGTSDYKKFLEDFLDEAAKWRT